MTAPDAPPPGRQLGLFGAIEDDAAPAPARVRPAAPATDAAELAGRLPASFRGGTSSWSFPGWRGLVWSADDPAPTADALARAGLPAYAAHPLLRAAGLDRTYYRPMSEAAYRALAAQVPADFRFVVKATRDLCTPFRPDGSDDPAFCCADRLGGEVLAPARRGLGATCGCVVVQLSPLGLEGPRGVERARRIADRVAAGLGAIDVAERPPLAVEVRDALFVHDAVRDDWLAALAAAGAAPAFGVHPASPPIAEQVAAFGGAQAGASARPPAPILVRWMLRAGETYEGAKARFQPFAAMAAPDRPVREAIAAVCRAAADAGRETIVIANNKAEGSAPLTIHALARAIVATVAPAAGRPSPP